MRPIALLLLSLLLISCRTDMSPYRPVGHQLTTVGEAVRVFDTGQAVVRIDNIAYKLESDAVMKWLESTTPTTFTVGFRKIVRGFHLKNIINKTIDDLGDGYIRTTFEAQHDLGFERAYEDPGVDLSPFAFPLYHIYQAQVVCVLPAIGTNMLDETQVKFLVPTKEFEPGKLVRIFNSCFIESEAINKAHAGPWYGAFKAHVKLYGAK